MHDSGPRRSFDVDEGLLGRLKRYARASGGRSAVEIAITLAPLIAITVLGLVAVRVHFWWGALLAIPGAGFLVRLFMIQHDCGHHAFFPARWLNNLTGRILAVLTLTPYDYWRRTHAMHHATSGELDRHTLGGITTLTVQDYVRLSPLKRFGYRLYRHPLVMFGLGPPFVFMLLNRLPVGMMKQGWRPWLSTQLTNLGIAGLLVGILIGFGVWPVLLFWLPMMLLGASFGVWLFFVQHQFEDTYWARGQAWDFKTAALFGSSHYELPAVLRWFTANIGIHHVHHLNSHIPYYRLGRVMRDETALRSVSRLTLWQSFRCVRLALWDEAGQRLISFRELRRQQA